jgi:hypothetical protein
LDEVLADEALLDAVMRATPPAQPQPRPARDAGRGGKSFSRGALYELLPNPI